MLYKHYNIRKCRLTGYSNSYKNETALYSNTLLPDVLRSEDSLRKSICERNSLCNPSWRFVSTCILIVTICNCLVLSYAVDCWPGQHNSWKLIACDQMFKWSNTSNGILLAKL